ncbi:MAG: endonuclease/exonuclease/phosphatase family protein [Bacteriovoracaceae bacterium]
MRSANRFLLLIVISWSFNTHSFMKKIQNFQMKKDHTESLKLMTLNLHGFHPMGEKPRVIEEVSGKKRTARPHPFYFNRKELERGNSKRAKIIANQISTNDIDIVAFQEVASSGDGELSCDDFYRTYPKKSRNENMAIRVRKGINPNRGYKTLLACRGNIGWWTDPNSFSNSRILDVDGKVIFDYGANPYPNGLVMEGMALILSKKIEVITHLMPNIEFNVNGDKIFVQFLEFRVKGQKKWFTLFNVHLGHKLAHFEQATAVQLWLGNYLGARASDPDYGGNIVLGDFNAHIYKGNKSQGAGVGESSFIPWIEKGTGYDFSYTKDFELKKIKLKELLYKLNQMTSYKGWATVKNVNEVHMRIKNAVFQFEDLVANFRVNPSHRLKSSLVEVNDKKICLPKKSLSGYCKKSRRIDYILIPKWMNVKNAFITHKENSWTSLKGVSDHPGIYASLEY